MDPKRKTIQRQLTFDAVRELGCHATAEQVYAHIAAKHPSISRGTVYRNLGQLTEAGELQRIGSTEDSCRYDHNCHNHYHFVCNECRRVFDINDYFDDITQQLSGAKGFEITGHSIMFKGLCPECGALARKKAVCE